MLLLMIRGAFFFSLTSTSDSGILLCAAEGSNSSKNVQIASASSPNSGLIDKSYPFSLF